MLPGLAALVLADGWAAVGGEARDGGCLVGGAKSLARHPVEVPFLRLPKDALRHSQILQREFLLVFHNLLHFLPLLRIGFVALLAEFGDSFHVVLDDSVEVGDFLWVKWLFLHFPALELPLLLLNNRRKEVLIGSDTLILAHMGRAFPQRWIDRVVAVVVLHLSVWALAGLKLSLDILNIDHVVVFVEDSIFQQFDTVELLLLGMLGIIE